MNLAFKHDFEGAKSMWLKFWSRENERPLVCGKRSCAPEGTPSPYAQRYFNASTEMGQRKILDAIDATFPATEFVGEAIPFFDADLGPDQFGAALGASLLFDAEKKESNWVSPIVENLCDFHIDMETVRQNPTYRAWLKWTGRLSQHAKGRYLVGSNDFHSALDALSAIRGPQNLCLDLFDCPDEVERVVAEIRGLYIPIFEDLSREAGWTRESGYIGWIPAWSPGRYAVTQCDFGYMISDQDFRRYALPAIEAESNYLEHTVYHLDGIGNLRHLEGILALPRVEAIQWVPGDGQKPIWEWTELLREIAAAGKMLQIHCPTVDAVKSLHRDLNGYRGVLYCVGEDVTPAKFEELMKFFN